MTDLYDSVMTIEDSDDFEERRRAMQALIDSGLAWTLQGRVGREASDLIEQGACVLGVEGRRDYWGNYVPSRTEVEAGTKGSVEYARARGFEVAA